MLAVALRWSWRREGPPLSGSRPPIELALSTISTRLVTLYTALRCLVQT